ncbi:MAG: hypothetical protein JST05_02985 [Acidobacteria bacterium]|nr:hypothetical protein [Acidobacteriota bacterium]
MTRWFNVGLLGTQDGEPYFTVIKIVTKTRREAMRVTLLMADREGLAISRIEWARGHRTGKKIPFGHVEWGGTFHFFPKEQA